MLINTSGLILREVNYRDSDKMLTILTRDRGKISASCAGARSRRSNMRAGTQLFAYSDFTLFEGKGRYSLNEAEPVELFMGVRNDISRLSLASYMAEVLEAIADEEEPDAGLLSTGLNCLYALSVGKKNEKLIKAVFELRVAAHAGFAPELTACAVCGDTGPERPCLDISGGTLVCERCAPAESVRLSRESLAAMRYVLGAEEKRILSFSLQGTALVEFSSAAERYLLHRLERGFRTLDFYRAVSEEQTDGGSG